MLVQRGCSGLQIIEQDDGFFGTDQFGPGGAAELPEHLLIILHVESVLRFDLRQLLIKIAGAREISGLHAGMRQQFHHFADVAGVAGLLEKIQQLLQRVGIIPHMPDDGVQALQNLAGIFRQQPVGMLVKDQQRVLVLPSLHESVGEAGDGVEIVVNVEQLARNGACFRELSGLEIGLQQVAQSIRIGIDIGNFLQRSDRGGGVPGLDQVFSLHQQRIAVVRIQLQHALQNFIRLVQGAFCAQGLGGGGEDLPGFVLFVQPNVNFGQPDPHSAVFRIHLQNLLEDSHRIVEFVGL